MTIKDYKSVMDSEDIVVIGYKDIELIFDNLAVMIPKELDNRKILYLTASGEHPNTLYILIGD